MDYQKKHKGIRGVCKYILTGLEVLEDPDLQKKLVGLGIIDSLNNYQIEDALEKVEELLTPIGKLDGELSFLLMDLRHIYDLD